MPAEVTESTERTGKPQSNGATETKTERRDSTGVAKRRCAIGSNRENEHTRSSVFVFTIDPIAPVGLRRRPTRRILCRVTPCIFSVQPPLLRVSVVMPFAPSPPLTGSGIQRQ